jgi:hypothetical protein
MMIIVDIAHQCEFLNSILEIFPSSGVREERFLSAH